MSDPVWLTDDQRAAWTAMIDTMRRLFSGLDEQLQRDSAMTHATYAVLVALSGAPDRTLSMGALSAETRFSPSRLSHLVRGIEHQGWVRRTVDVDDRRRTFATLTAPGRKALEHAAPGHVELVRSTVFKGLSDRDVKVITRVFHTIGARLESPGGGEPDRS